MSAGGGFLQDSFPTPARSLIMELKKIVKTNSVTVEDDAQTISKIKLIDVKTAANLNSFGEVRIDNFDDQLTGKFKIDDEISVELGLSTFQGPENSEIIYTGIIEKIFDDTLIILELKGKGELLKRKKFKKSFNQIDVAAIIRDIMNGTGIDFELGEISNIRRHSYVAPNGTILQEINRVNESFGLELIPFFDRTGKLILKTFDENIKETDVEFDTDEFKRFEDETLETILDVEIDLFNKIRILDVDYIVNAHRFFLDDRRSKSFITVEEDRGNS